MEGMVERVIRRAPTGRRPVRSRARHLPRPAGRDAALNRGLAMTGLTVRSILTDRKTLALGILLLLLLAIPVVWLRNPSTEEDAEMEVFMTIMIIVYLQFIVLYTCLLYASSLVTSESDDRTMTYLISRPISRLEIMVFKYIGYVISMFIIFATAVILNYMILAPHGGTDGFMRNSDMLAFTLGGILIGIIAWGALFLLMASMFRNPIMPGFLYCLFWESVLANIGGNISKATVTYQIRTFIFNGVTRIGDELSDGDLPVHGEYAPGDAFAFAVVAAFILLTFAWLFLRRRDFN
jgi:ABC-2 type transport system permease protein